MSFCLRKRKNRQHCSSTHCSSIQYGVATIWIYIWTEIVPRRLRWDSELRTLFKKIDAGCSETVTWEESRNVSVQDGSNSPVTWLPRDLRFDVLRSLRTTCFFMFLDSILEMVPASLVLRKLKASHLHCMNSRNVQICCSVCIASDFSDFRLSHNAAAAEALTGAWQCGHADCPTVLSVLSSHDQPLQHFGAAKCKQFSIFGFRT